MGYMEKKLEVDIPDWCEGCDAFDLTLRQDKPGGVKRITCENLEYCAKRRAELEGVMANGNGA